jgi:hypothetical protein
MVTLKESSLQVGDAYKFTDYRVIPGLIERSERAFTVV